ncbi:hypothetical protein BBH99_00195 [Chryseobacterium contaminans]|uniref:Uncharacterized protein n=1 Tax=Chryseobacterium contaminans TaxID=1423959 RepID=A0A1M6VLU6_9FLAO|nr:hypothetical protein [Chryseobacterium contaminans]OCA80557.1 hypothetical protein BBH99_00195 [Chryseobacterium contaminans]SHK82473.1 hypothetical protein SAMN05444407_101272 [Chryseobacterium contaminans]
MKKSILFIAFLMFMNHYSQTSMVEDTKGESALSLGSLSVISVNAKDESLAFSTGWNFSRFEKDPEKMYWGVTLKAKGKNGVFNIIKNKDFQYDGNIGLFIGYLSAPSEYSDALNSSVLDVTMRNTIFSIEFLTSQFKLYNNSSNIKFTDQIYGKGTYGYKIAIGHNGQGSIKNKVPYVFGIQLNGGKKNNSSDLNYIEIGDVSYETDINTNTTREIVRGKVLAYDLKEFRDNLGYFNINSDFGVQVKSRFLFILHWRYSVMQGFKPRYNPGFGFYLTKEGEPTRIVCGIQYQSLDLFNVEKSQKSLGQRSSLNMIAGYSF